MKRSPMPARKAPMKRTPLRRRAEIAATSERHPARSMLAAQSPKRKAENRVRAAWRIDRCALEGYGSCRGPIDLHEIVRRNGAPSGRTDRRIVIGLCRGHHEIDEDVVEAERVGIRIRSHDWTRCAGNAADEQALIDLAARRRAAVIVNGVTDDRSAT